MSDDEWGWRSPRRPMSTAEKKEFVRRMDNFQLASRLWSDEKVARGILAHPSDPRREIASQLLDVITRIRLHRRIGLDAAMLVLNWQRLVRQANATVLRPLVEIGNKAKRRSRKGVEARLAALADAKYVAAFLKHRPSARSDWGAATRAAKSLGVSPRTVFRAWKRNHQK
jgi:hypothetical protein